MYNLKAANVTVKAIGTVESNLNYEAINYADPITVGIAQWFGERAANLLNRMRLENPSAWEDDDGEVTDALIKHGDAGWDWWADFYLSKAGGQSIKNTLRVNAAIQNDQLRKDLDEYKKSAIRMGMDPDGNTQAFMFWCTIHHQSPKSAKQILQSVGANATLEQFYAASLNHRVVGKYKTRQTKCYTIIKSMDDSGLPGGPLYGPADMPVGGDPSAPDTPDTATDGADRGQLGANPPNSTAAFIQYVSPSLVILTDVNGNKAHAIWDGVSAWRVRGEGAGGGAVVPPDPAPTPPSEPEPEPTPTPTPNPPVDSKSQQRAAVVKWMTSREKKFKYRQAPGRLNPDKSGFGDCSSTVYRAYLDVTGINIGTYTGNQYNSKAMVTIKKGSGALPVSFLDSMLPGDLIYMKYRGSKPVNHVEMYAGNGMFIGHGGGPTASKPGPVWNNARTSFRGITYYWVRRVIR